MSAFLYPTRGFSAGSWQGPASALNVSNGSSFVSLVTSKKSAFYYNGSAWKRFFSGIPSAANFNATGFDPDRITTCSFKMFTNGTTKTSGTGSSPGSGVWDEAGQLDIGDWEVYAQKQSFPSGTSGTFDTWIDMTSDRTWTLLAPPGVERELVMYIYIRHKPSGVQVGYLDITLACGGI